MIRFAKGANQKGQVRSQGSSLSSKHREWDIDHQPAWTNRNFPDGAKRKGVLDDYQRETRFDCASCNRSRGNRE
ncbi:GH-E family nuclease [Marininema halotolerans]|uniref:GH-E family nuclease n=1 Tax=Marininema halotolerans TaxID=1155944 RepID=UPI001595FB42